MTQHTFTCPDWAWILRYDACDAGIEWACTLFGATHFAHLITRQEQEGPLVIGGTVTDLLVRMLHAEATLTQAQMVYTEWDAVPEMLTPTWCSVAFDVSEYLMFIEDMDRTTKEAAAEGDVVAADIFENMPEGGHMGRARRDLIDTLTDASFDPHHPLWSEVLDRLPPGHKGHNIKLEQ